MTPDERWIANYNEVVEFIETNHRNPSRHRIEEHDMLNWLKANRKEDEYWWSQRGKTGNVQGIVGTMRTI